MSLPRIILIALLTTPLDCVVIERVQVGPDTWPSFTSSRPASQPSDIQTSQEIIDEVLGDIETSR